MNAIRHHIHRVPTYVLRSTLALAVLALVAVTPPALAGGRPGTPPQSSAFGKTLAEWSAIWWKVGIETPFVPGSPFFDGGIFPLSGSVMGLAAPIGSGTFEFTLPVGKALVVAGITFECSSLEPPPSGFPGGFHGDTATEQAACAKSWADQIEAMSFTVDGKPVNGIVRVVSPQFSFIAPDPNVLFVPGGPGTAVADGFYVLLAPMSKGEHTIHIQGSVLGFDVDNLFHITVE